MSVVDLPDEAATARLAARISALAEIGDVIALSGDLGAGKTTFVRAFIRARGETGAFSIGETLRLLFSDDGGTDAFIIRLRLYRALCAAGVPLA